VFWQVENAEAAAIRIADYRQAIERGRADQPAGDDRFDRVAEAAVRSERRPMNCCGRRSPPRPAAWGVTASSVEIKDVSIPAKLQTR